MMLTRKRKRDASSPIKSGKGDASSPIKSGKRDASSPIKSGKGDASSPIKSGKDDNSSASPQKKCKEGATPSSECLSRTGSEASPALSPKQKERMEKSRTAALSKLHSKTTHGLLNNVGPSWLEALEPEFSKQYFIKLSEFVDMERKKFTVYPKPDQVFTWTQMCDINDVKVVILGQDPYHGPGQAHGLCFSVPQGIKSPPSLENIYKELVNNIEGFRHPGHGVLIGWAKQGVLLLNACLTVREHQANSHKDKGWEKFTDAVISWLNKNKSGLVFLLWGAYAQKKCAFIDKKKHHILKSVHPSPLSAHRGFLGCKHFSQCNSLLESQNRTPVDWKCLPPN